MINTLGAVTGVVLVVVTIVKFTHGAWIVLVAVPILVTLMLSIRRHYRAVAAQLRSPVGRKAQVASNRAPCCACGRGHRSGSALRREDPFREGIECIHAVEADTDETSYAWRAMHPQRPSPSSRARTR